uniref:Uncharacterized protein n=1 Tax=Eptatretus burgeri TaxID=7764 RepID=A0A8C4NGS3_EPTBU
MTQLHSTQEEADTRMLPHAHYISTQGIRSIIIKSPDTDVFVICVALVSHLVGSQLYFHTGRDNNVHTIDLQAIQQELGDDIAKAIIGLHCFTGCDSVSSFYGKGKTKAIKLLTQNKSFSHACQMLGESFSITDELVSLLEDFVCKLYSQQEYSHVNDARYSMFSMATRNESVMPPNRDALIKQVQRANFQAAVCKRSFDNHPDIPSPAGHAPPPSVTDELVSLLEDFVCKLYSQQEYSHVNNARYSMFLMATRNESIMPPNRDALIKHVQRANFQAAV